jgi:hypothetical protein
MMLDKVEPEHMAQSPMLRRLRQGPPLGRRGVRIRRPHLFPLKISHRLARHVGRCHPEREGIRWAQSATRLLHFDD